MNVHRNAAAVIVDHYAVVHPDRHIYRVAKTGRSLVDTVINNLVYKVVEALFTGASDVHGRALADGFEAFEYFYAVG
jgi:hypothetical protein